MSTPLVFDVFGKRIEAVRAAVAWELFEVGNEGRKRRFSCGMVPPELSEDQLISFLEERFHEYAARPYPRVRRIG